MIMEIGIGIVFLVLVLGIFALRSRLDEAEQKRDEWKMRFLSMERRYIKLEDQFNRLCEGLQKVQTEKRLDEI